MIRCGRILGKSKLNIILVNYAWSPVEIRTPIHWNLERPQYNRPVACVMAQQHSSATFISMRFYSFKEKQKSVLFKFVYILKLRISETA
jgi:hypothetical protein